MTLAATFAADAAPPEVREWEVQSLRDAITDLAATYGRAYADGDAYLERLAAWEQNATGTPAARRAAFEALKREALLANPLLRSGSMLVVKRRPKNTRAPDFFTEFDAKIGKSNGAGREIGFPSNHECNSSLERTGYDNEIAVLSPIAPDGTLTTLHRPDDGSYVGEMDLHWDAACLLFTRSHPDNWRVWEIGMDGKGLRQVSQMPSDVDAGDACYLPNGNIVFGSTASYQSVPCWHGQKRVSHLYLMRADGTGVRQLCFDQDHNFHPVVLNNGQILYHRWDYTGISHIFMRQLMVMNPDGTGQRAVYGSNSWYPNALYFPRPLPGKASEIVTIFSGYHGVHRMGQLVRLDTAAGFFSEDGLVQRISGQHQEIAPLVQDDLVSKDWPKFLHPYPISDKHFLVAAWIDKQSQWAIYLADVFDNLVLVHAADGYALLEPVFIAPRAVPPVIPDRVDLARDDGEVYLHNVYAGPGLDGVPRDTIQSLRVISYHFAYPGLGGPDKIGYGGPWEVMRILGTVPVESDGSAFFRVPANTPVAVQPLDAQGKAVQQMRSWFTAMPGEKVSCVGCHETPADAVSPTPSLAAQAPPRALNPWYGPARGFDFAREVQPVLNRHCVACHDGNAAKLPDLRPEEDVPDHVGRRLSDLGVNRLHPAIFKATGGVMKYTPAYLALIPYLRRVGIEDDVSLLLPGEYHVDTSPLVQMLQRGHYGVRLDAEGWDRIVTWIDLNAPCHGTWGDVYPLQDGVHERRQELRAMYGGPRLDPEVILPLAQPQAASVPAMAPVSQKEVRRSKVKVATLAGTPKRVRIAVGDGIDLALVRLPAGSLHPGDGTGPIRIPQSFWMGQFEITNAQYRLFDPTHDSRYYTKRHARADDQGRTLNDPDQPVVRVSWDQAMAFCAWLSERAGLEFTLPTEDQWEFACRAGTDTAFSFGGLDTDFSACANVADRAFATGYDPQGRQVTGGVHHLVMEGAFLADQRFDDGASVTMPVGSYRPNVWGLHDMHGNAAEWTRSAYDAAGLERAVRGGSFYDRPDRCASDFRIGYPTWQRVFNVGFRVVCEDNADGLDSRLARATP